MKKGTSFHRLSDKLFKIREKTLESEAYDKIFHEVVILNDEMKNNKCWEWQEDNPQPICDQLHPKFKQIKAVQEKLCKQYRKTPEYKAADTIYRVAIIEREIKPLLEQKRKIEKKIQEIAKKQEELLDSLLK